MTTSTKSTDVVASKSTDEPIVTNPVEAKNLEAEKVGDPKSAEEDAKAVADEKQKANEAYVKQAQKDGDPHPDQAQDHLHLEPQDPDPTFKSQERTLSEQETESNERRNRLTEELAKIHEEEDNPDYGTDLGVVSDLADPDNDLEPLKPQKKDPRRKTQKQTLREQKWEHADRNDRIKKEWNEIVKSRGLETKPNSTYVQTPRDKHQAEFLKAQNKARKDSRVLLPEDKHGKLTAQNPNYVLDDPSLHITQDYLADEVNQEHPRVDFTYPVDAPC